MINPANIESQLELYAMSFTFYQPSNTKSLSYHLFMKVDLIIQNHTTSIYDLSTLTSATSDVDALIRKLKVAYGHVNDDLNEIEYPKFLAKLQALKVGKFIVSYHNSITHLLKLLLYIFSESGNPTEVTTEIDSFLSNFIKNLQPRAKQTKKFKDIVNFDIGDSNQLLNKIRKKQLDIIFDDDF
ncbi:hypothetical protein AN214_03106 [Pseudoalteromonas sp. P1-9]|uniref:hypothetical protein n=1 Tax=Pseudoalteromonas sp. P1-9 TaxID=1710354 RepID=UPI0006D61FC4|nr:hypothetical protein [Pseudoalteromonas sp. P1-9]KPV94805.1 hypothetical protein AN214_03106 [Pseudoalteromonas sp. P1-9]